MSQDMTGRRLLACALVSFAAAARADEAAPAPAADPEPVRAELVAEGQPARLGVRFEIAPGWHIYGREVGEVGLPTRLAWRVDGASVGEIAWPEPVAFSDAALGVTSHGYTGAVLLSSPVEVGAWNEGARRARVDVDWLACADVCVPGKASLERDVRAELGGGGGAVAGGPSLWRALALGFLGGLLLNLMPCVLPVLALKAFALADLAGRSRRECAAHGAGYVAGVLATMLALAGLVLALRAAGTAVGWGFQFQEPAYSLGLAALLVVLALNLFGVFEVAAPAGLASVGANAAGVTRSFFDGLLAVALATPCSAPFLGTAVGFAFASPAPFTLAVFAALGLGLAAPLALVVLVPGFAARLPRSGAWMGRLRTVLGFALLASACWLLWIFGRLAGVDALGAALASLVALGLGAWIFGLQQQAERGGRGLVAGATVALAVFVALNPLVTAQAEAPRRAEASYSPELVTEHLRGGRPVFLTFTADWCLTCKANEKTVIASERVQAELARGGYAVLKADWTRRDEAIRRELARFGKAGVPLYVIWRPDAPDAPRVLPELLTVDGLVEALRDGA
jgi:thiol:disulfide interchange protein DsbD